MPWIMTNVGFLSVVADRTNPANLLVRARAKGHIEALFPDAAVHETAPDETSDYLYRASIDRTTVADRVWALVDTVAYDNFKASVEDHELHDAYLGVWTVMHRYQQNCAVNAPAHRRKATYLASLAPVVRQRNRKGKRRGPKEFRTMQELDRWLFDQKSR